MASQEDAFFHRQLFDVMGLNKVVAERYNRVLKVAGVVPDVTAASKMHAVQPSFN